MLDLTIYSYGYSEIIYQTLQAIALFRNMDFYTTMVTTVALISGVIYSIQMVTARGEGEWRVHLRRVIGMTIFIHALLLPKVTMSVKDHVEKHYWRVDNIPLAFALPIGIIENFGHILTAGFEQAFSKVDGISAHNYYHYGTVFGARLQKEVLQAKVRDPEFINNMSNFIERCVILPSMIGKQFTKEELVASEDMWGLISSRAGTFTRTPMTINGVRVDPHPKCKDAVEYFERKFNDAIGLNITSWAWKFKGVGRDSKYNPGSRALNHNIKEQINAIYGAGGQVDSILKHNMMINAVNSYRSGKYPAAKAAMHHEAGGLISGDLAEKTLTGSLAVMKVIVYGSFIFLFPVLVLSGGVAKYRSWITAAFSLALWPALFSMLNMIIDFAYEPAKIVSYSTWATEMKKFDSIASTAANLNLMIPFLAFWITRMGEGGFMHLAGSIMASANNASAALAGEKASGMRSWDNENIRNQSNDNTSSYKHDSSMQYVSGAARMMMADGSMESITAGGKSLYFSGAGQSASSGESSYHQMAGWSYNHDEAVRYETQAMSSETAAKSIAQEKLYAQEVSALRSIVEHTKTDSGYNIDTSTEEGREISKHLNAIDRLNSTNNYGWEQNAKAYVSGEAGMSLPKWLLGARISAGGEVSVSNNSSQTDSSSNEISAEVGTNERRSNSERINRNESYLTSLGVDKNTQDSMRENYQEVERLDKSISEHKSRIDSHNRTMNYARSHSGQMSKDMYQNVVDAYQARYGGSARAAHEAVSSGSKAAMGVFKELSEKSYQAKFNEIHTQGNKIANTDNVNDFVKNNQVDSSIGNKRDEFANANNIRTDQDNVELEIASKGKDIKDRHSEKTDYNETEYEEREQINTEKQVDRAKVIDKYEEDRIGRGRISTVFGELDGVGRPTKKSNNGDLDLGDPIAKPYEPKASLYNWETGKLDPLPEGSGYTHKLNIGKPPQEVKAFDKNAAQNIIESFNPDQLDNSNTSKIKVKGGGQYVNPKDK